MALKILCNLDRNTSDSNEHVFIVCVVSNDPWNSIEGWIREIGVDEYKIFNNKNILDELEGAYWVDTIILNVKKSISLSKLKDNIPTIHQLKANTKLMYGHEQLKYKLRDKDDILEKRWGLLKDHYENKLMYTFFLLLSNNILYLYTRYLIT